MSFEDIETGAGSVGLPKQERSDVVAAGIFRINTSVSTYKRLVNTLGTARDNHALREKLHATEQKISQQVEETVAKLKEANETDHTASASTSKKVRDAKLAKDFQAVLLEFQSAQKAAQSRQRKYAPVLPPVSSLPELEARRGEEETALLQRQRLVVEANESEVMFNAVVIEEREQGIQEIQQQIGEVSEIFKDLAQIVANQGYVIDDIEANIESSASSTVQANIHLTRAAKSQKSSEYWKCVILAIIGTVLFAFLVILLA
jgi:syntaxin 7